MSSAHNERFRPWEPAGVPLLACIGGALLVLGILLFIFPLWLTKPFAIACFIAAPVLSFVGYRYRDTLDLVGSYMINRGDKSANPYAVGGEE